MKRLDLYYNLSNLIERGLFKQESGIYGLYFNNKCFYVGQSKDLQKRLREHSRWAHNLERLELNKEYRNPISYQKTKEMYEFIGKNYNQIKFKILTLCSFEELNHYEEMYISLYNPEYNYQGVNVEYKYTDRNEEGKVIRSKKQIFDFFNLG